MCSSVCVRRGWGVGHRILLLGNISVRTALLHHHPSLPHTHTHTPSAPAQGSSVAAEHMWPEYSKQSFIKSSTQTNRCDSQGTNDAWRPLNTPLTDQRACMPYTHTHHTQVFILACTDKLLQSLWRGGTHARSGKHTH